MEGNIQLGFSKGLPLAFPAECNNKLEQGLLQALRSENAGSQNWVKRCHTHEYAVEKENHPHFQLIFVTQFSS